LTEKIREVSKSKIIRVCFIIICLILVDILIVSIIRNKLNDPVGELKFYIKTESNLYIQMFYGEDEEFSEQKNLIKYYTGGQDKIELEFQYDISSDYIKLFFTPGWSELLICDMRIVGGNAVIPIDILQLQNPYALNDVELLPDGNDGIRIKPEGDDAWIVLKLSDYDVVQKYCKANIFRFVLYTVLLCTAVNLLILALLISNKEGYSVLLADTSPKYVKLSVDQIIIVLSVFLIAFSGAIMIAPVFCPDEASRRLLSNYIYSNGRLPTGNEPETMIYMWGFSYALRPYLSSIINAGFMKIISIFTASETVLLTASRMCSVLSLAGTANFSLKTGNLLFRKRISANLMGIIICFTPQVMFLGMYQNNDALSLFAISMEIFFLVKGYRQSWDLRTCIGLAVSYSVAILCYYSAIPWLLFGALFCVITCVKNPNLGNKASFIFRRFFLVCLLICILAGWFFIRNALLHNGDFLGIRSEEISRSAILESGMYQLVDFNRGYLMADSITDFLKIKDYEWIRWSLRSMIGCFGHMEIWLPLYQYGEYYALIIMAVIGFFLVSKYKKEKRMFRGLSVFFIASSAVTVLLSLYQSYVRDYEPQGRYIITVWLFIGYVFAVVNDNLSLNIGENNDDSEKKLIIIEPASIILWLWIIMFVRIWFETMSRMIV